MCKMGGGGGDGGAAAQARADEAARQARVNEAIGRVNSTFGQFDDSFFAQRQDAHRAYYIPQLERQFGEARQNLAFSLADRGLTRSSAAAKSLADLEREYALRRQEVTDEAASYAQRTRADIEGARGNLINLASSTGDSATVGNSAVNEAARFTAAPSFSPLGQIFQNAGAGVLANTEAGRVSDLRRGGGGARVFKSGGGSSRVVG